MADAICGPVAAIAFARATGRNPTIAEALEIARRNGRWDAQTGMHGPPSEKALLDDMGIPNRLEPNPSREAVIRDVANGNPVILSSPGHYHYFVVTGYDPRTGLFDTGNTGTALKGGSRYRTWEDIGPQAALFMQEPTAGGASVATAADMSPQQGTPAVASGRAPADTSAVSVQGRMAPQEFVNTLLPVAQAHSRQTGIPVEYYLAAAAHESGWGGSGNTLFGIKGEGATFATYEVQGGKDVPQDASFRTYPNADAAFSDFDQLVTSGRYAPAYQRFQQTHDAHQFWNDITAAGYATDQTWGDKIARMADGTIAPLLGTAGAATNPAGTPMGRANDSPFAPAEQPYSPATFSNLQQPSMSDPWAAVNATVQDTRDRIANLGRGAAGAAANVNRGATDALNAGGDALVSEVSRPHDLAGMLEQGIATRPELQAPLAVARAVVPEDVQQGALGVARGLLNQPDFTQPLSDPAMEAEAQRAAAADRTGNPRALEYARSAIMGAFGTFGASDLQAGADAARGAVTAAADTLPRGVTEVPRPFTPEAGAVPAAAPLGRDVGSAPVNYALAHGATAATGGLGGGLYGYATAPAGSTEQQKRERALQYGTIGAGLGLAAGVPIGLAAAKGGARAVAFTDPGVQAIVNMHERAVASPSVWQKLAAPLKDIGTQFEEQFLDDFARGNAVTTEARRALGVKDASKTPRSIDFEALAALWRGRDAAGAQWVQGGLGKVYEHLTTPVEEQALNAVLKLRRDIEVANIRLAKGVNPADLKFSGNVTSVADANAKLAAIQRQLGPQAWGRLQQAEAAFRAHMDSILDAKVKSGLIDSQWAAWLKAKHPNYSPSILADDAGAAATSTGKKLSVESHGVKRLSETGHVEDDLPPLTAATIQTLKENARVMQNDAASALAHALETAPRTRASVARVPNVKLTTGTNIAGGVPGTTVVGRQPPVHIPGTISWWEGGTRHFLKVPDEFRPLVEGLQKDPATAQAAGVFGQLAHKILVGPQQLARQFITAKNPVFPLINAQADMLVAMAQGISPFKIAAGYAGRNQAEVTRLGGMVTGWHGSGVQGAADLQRAMAPSGGILVSTPGALVKAMKYIATAKPVEQYGSAIERGPREAAYRAALARGATPERAALAYRRVTLDFARAGALVRKANAYILFLNAAVQGTAQIVRVARDNPKAAALFVGALNAATFGAYEWNRSFEREDGTRYYDDIPDYVKQTSLVLMAPGGPNGGTFTDQNGKRMMHYVAVPLRQLGALGWAGTQAAQAMHREMPEDYMKFMVSLGLRTLSPVQGESASQLVGSALPLGIGTAAELAAGKDFYRGTDIIPQRQQGLSTESQVGTHATETAKLLGKATRYIPLIGEAAPANVQHVIDTLGGTAQQLVGLADIAQGATGSGEQAIYRSTVGRLYRDQGGQIERDVGDRYAGGLDAAKAHAFEALQRSPQWAAATDEQARNSLERATYAQVEKQFQQQPDVQTPDWAQPQQPDGPPKYDPRILPPSMRAQYEADPYRLQRDISEAQDVVAAYNRDPRNNPRPTREQQQLAAAGKYVSPEWTRWNVTTNRPATDARRRLVRGLARDVLATPAP